MGIKSRWVGLTVLKIGRVLGTMNMEVGRGSKVTVILEFMCPWRIRTGKGDQILLASYDMFNSNSKIEWSEDFEWEVIGNTLFDEKVDQGVFQEEVTIKEINENPIGDINIVFSNGYVLEYFCA